MTKNAVLDIAIVLCEDGLCTPVVFNTPLWEATMKWVKFHGLDPMRIPAGSVVERDAQRCEIRYDEYVLNEVGSVARENGMPRVMARVERGEAPPLPFPRP